MKSTNRFLLKMLEHITPGLTSNVVSFFFFFYEYKLAEFLKKIEKITGELFLECINLHPNVSE